jgi:polyisoprenoid-binding protein YceI
LTDLQTERGIVRVPTGTWTVDPAHSSVGFEVKRTMIATVRGRFTEFEGTIEAHGVDVSAVRAGS